MGSIVYFIVLAARTYLIRASVCALYLVTSIRFVMHKNKSVYVQRKHNLYHLSYNRLTLKEPNQDFLFVCLFVFLDIWVEAYRVEAVDLALSSYF